MHEYTVLLQRLYDAILDVSGASIIVDSSKIATFALLLRRAGVRLHVLHLVRDSRGVLFSWQKQVAREDAADKPDVMLRYGVLTGSLRYIFYNSLVHLLRLLRVPYRRMRYEDLIRQPLPGLRAVAEYADVHVDAGLEGELSRRSVRLGPDHTVDGNTMRLNRGTVRLRLDDAWMDGMSPRSRRAVTALTLPLLARYGYLQRPRSLSPLTNEVPVDVTEGTAS